MTCFKYILAPPLKGPECPQNLSKLIHYYGISHCFWGETLLFLSMFWDLPTHSITRVNELLRPKQKSRGVLDWQMVCVG